MTLSDLETFVKNIIAEDSTPATSALFSTAQLDVLINIANREIWREVVKANQSIYQIRSADKTFVAATGYYDYSALNTAGVYLLTGIEFKYQNSYYSVDQGSPQDRFLYENTTGLTVVTSVVPSIHYIEGEYLYLSPAPTENQTVRFSFIPPLPDMTSSVVALGGKLVDYHMLVGYRAAALLLTKDESKSAAVWEERCQEGLKDLRQHLARRNTQSGRRMKYRPY